MILKRVRFNNPRFRPSDIFKPGLIMEIDSKLLLVEIYRNQISRENNLQFLLSMLETEALVDLVANYDI